MELDRSVFLPRRSARLEARAAPFVDVSESIPPPPRLIRQDAARAGETQFLMVPPHATIRWPVGTRFLQMRFASSMNPGMFNVVEMALRDVPGGAPVAEQVRVYSASSDGVENSSLSDRQGLADDEIEQVVRVRARGRETRARKRARRSAALDECAICLEPMDDELSDLCDLPCRHAFHAACIRRWLREKPTCACCRVDVRESNAS